jgi:hypothetical protein
MLTKDAIVALLSAHRYSASPWTCSCGAHLGNSDLRAHQADVIAASQ